MGQVTTVNLCEGDGDVFDVVDLDGYGQFIIEPNGNVARVRRTPNGLLHALLERGVCHLCIANAIGGKEVFERLFGAESAQQ
jgi:hypothetical protein